MKTSLKLTVVLAGIHIMCPGARAALLYSWTGSQPIPDNSGSGVAFNFTLAGTGAAITDVQVDLSISGGWNGDLYGYLTHGPGVAVLLNRVGVGQATPGASPDGYGDSGFAITLSSAGAGNVHDYANHLPAIVNGRLTGTWQPDGREVPPGSPRATFDAPGTWDFSTFENLNPNGDWVLFLADVSPLSLSTLDGFTVRVTDVPEPSATAAAIVLAIASFAFHCGRRCARVN